jgi:hypothetical protein
MSPADARAARGSVPPGGEPEESRPAEAFDPGDDRDSLGDNDAVEDLSDGA